METESLPVFDETVAVFVKCNVLTFVISANLFRVFLSHSGFLVSCRISLWSCGESRRWPRNLLHVTSLRESRRETAADHRPVKETDRLK